MASILWGLVALGLAFGVVEAQRVHRTVEPPEIKRPYLYLPRGEYARLLAFGFEGLAADLLWIRSVIYYGEHYFQRDPTYYENLIDLLDLATDLDPRYRDVYWHGSALVPTVEERIRVLEKGIERIPSEWRFPARIGLNYSWYLKDPLKAAPYYEQASKIPGSPPYVASIAAHLYRQGGAFEAALGTLYAFHQAAPTAEQREYWGDRIKQLEGLRYLQSGVETFRLRYGRDPGDLREMVRAGVIASIPEEPFEGEYFFDPEEGRVMSSTEPYGMGRYRVLKAKKGTSPSARTS